MREVLEAVVPHLRQASRPPLSAISRSSDRPSLGEYRGAPLRRAPRSIAERRTVKRACAAHEESLRRLEIF